ncbi:MAG: peptidoglycan DD-metalloendopeptidase family protein [Spirochaetales bacterium]|nr:peptidoglycan DD-metalloendopeptidase family protein [Spirochaetales bacterium]
MIVTPARQEIDKSLLRKKKQKQYRSASQPVRLSTSFGASLRSTSQSRARIRLSSGKSDPWQSSISPFAASFLTALCFFFLILGTELPYRQLFPSRALHRLTIPGEIAMEQVEIRALRAETPVVMPGNSSMRTTLWEVPHQNYRIKDGERLSAVSQRYGITMSTLISYNHLETINSLNEGDVLLIPSVDGILYSVQKNETLDDIIRTREIDKTELIRYNPYIALEDQELVVTPGQEVFLPGASLSEEELRSRTGQLYIFPIQGRILTGYGNVKDSVTQIESFHNGIDIKGDTGDPVAASFDGTVISAGYNSSYGKFVVVDHRNGYQSLYAHLDTINVNRNDKVLQGEMIGRVGKSGYAPVTHLHFSLFKGKKSVDPLDYLH